MKLLDQAVLVCVEPYLTPDVIADAVAAAVKRAGSRPAVAAERARLDRELKVVEDELGRLVAFIKQGTASETVQQELGKSEPGAATCGQPSTDSRRPTRSGRAPQSSRRSSGRSWPTG
jgi:hypothetical protein